MGLIGEVWADAGLHVDGSSFAQYGAMLKQAEGQVSGFSDGIKAAMATAFTIPAAAVTGIAAYGTSIAASYEDANLTLKTLYGSQEAAQEKFQWLSDFAASTPFEFPELLEAATRLKAYGMDIEQYGQSIGDTAAAMGKPIMDVVEALADARQGEFERLKEFGIKSIQITKSNYQQLGVAAEDAGKTALSYTDKYGKEQIAVVDRNNKEMISSTVLSIWNPLYAGAMEERSKSLNGMLSTIKDNLKAGLADIVGFDMQTASIEGGSLLSVLKDLAGVALTVSGGFSSMSEPMQTFVLISTVGGAAALALAGGLMAASLAGIKAAAVTSALGFAVNTVIWPATLIVGTLALVAAGLVYLDQKTGIVTSTWEVLKDVFVITVDYISRAARWLREGVVEELDKIKQSILDFIPEGTLDSVESFYNTIKSWFGDAAKDIDEKATQIKEDNARAAESFDKYSDVDLSGTAGQINTVDELITSLEPNVQTNTGLLEDMGNVSMPGTLSQVAAVDSSMQTTTGTADDLGYSITAAGNIVMGGTISQISMVDSTGKVSALTISQLKNYLEQSGNVSQGGTIGQLAIVDSTGKVTNITTQQAINLLKTAGNQNMSGTIGQINGITSAWNTAAQAAANAIAKQAIAQRSAEKILEESYGTGSNNKGNSSGGVTVRTAAQAASQMTDSERISRQANNTVYNNLKIQNNYEASKSSTSKTKRATGG